MIFKKSLNPSDFIRIISFLFSLLFLSFNKNKLKHGKIPFLKTIISLLFILFTLNFNPLAGAELRFIDFFQDTTMRVDYYHTGNAAEEEFTVDQIYRYGSWAGNPHHLIDEFNNGKYYLKIYDVAANRLIFSRGFNSYFGEYQTTRQALDGNKRTYHESVLFPLPTSPFLLVIEVRDKQNILRPRFVQKIDPADYHIIRENPAQNAQLITVQKKGPAHNHVDVVFISEGYTAAEFDLFKKDLQERAKLLFTVSPYRESKDRFNIYGVFSPSQQSGVDEPRRRVYRNTVLNASFNAFDSPRYLLTEDNRALRNLAGLAPYDAIFIMVNSKRYGGGGIYNQFAVFTAHSPATELVFVHEFGHSFAGLADEYYTSSTSYNEFYPKGVEPTEPNITALLDSIKLKWPNEVNPGKAVPTPWNKAAYDSLSTHRQSLRRKIRDLEFACKKGEMLPVLRDSMQTLEAHLRNFIKNHPLKDKVGFFEGAGYSSKGLYRPMLNCMMFSNREKRFCRVCQQAIQRMINFYSSDR